MDEKSKNDKVKNTPRTGSVSFLLRWMAGYIAAWVVAMWLYITLDLDWSGQFLEALYVAFAPGILAALTQVWLVERGLGKSMRGWIPVSLAGLLASALTYQAYIQGLPTASQSIHGAILSILVPVAVVQWFWLRRRVSSAWLWVLGAIAGAIIFVLPLNTGINPDEVPDAIRDIVPFVLFAVAALFYSGATGATMLHLWSQERAKPKNEAALAQQSDVAERLNRLTDADSGEQIQPVTPSTTIAKSNAS